MAIMESEAMYEGGEKIPVPSILGEILGTPAMQALVRLGATQFLDRSYYGNKMNVMDIAGRYFQSAEDYATHVQNMRACYPDGIPGFGTDVRILCGALENLAQVRELWHAELLTHEAARHIYARLVELGKAHPEELREEDRVMFGFLKFEMETLMASGVAVLAFSTEVEKAVRDALRRIP